MMLPDADSNLFIREKLYFKNLLHEYSDWRTRVRYCEERFNAISSYLPYFQILVLLSTLLMKLLPQNKNEKRNETQFLLKDYVMTLTLIIFIAIQFVINRKKKKNDSRLLPSWLMCKCINSLFFLKISSEIGARESYYAYVFLTFLINYLFKANWLKNLIANELFSILISSYSPSSSSFINRDILTWLSVLNIGCAGIDLLDEAVTKNLWVCFDSFKRSTQAFSSLLDISTEAVFITDHVGRILYMNETGKNLFQLHRKLNPKRLPRNLSVSNLIEKDYNDLFERALAEAKNEGIGKICISLGGWDSEEKLRMHFEVKNLYRLTAKPFRWKGRPSFFISLSNQELMANYLRVNEKANSSVVSACSKIVDKLEMDYTKWNNLLALKYIRESDLKDLSNCVIELNLLKNSLFLSEQFVNTILRNDSQDMVNFNIRNTIVQTIELVSVTAIEKQIEVYLKFEDSFPETVYGSADKLKQLFLILLRKFLTCVLWPKLTKIHVECTLNKVLQSNKFMLLFSIKFPKNEALPELFKGKLAVKSESLTNYDVLEKLVFGNLDDEKVFRILLESMQAETFFHEEIADTNDKVDYFISLEIPFQAPELTTVITADNKQPPGSQTSKPLTLSFSRVSGPNNYFWKEKPRTQINPIKYQSRITNTITGIGATSTIAHATVLKKMLEKEREETSQKEEFDSSVLKKNELLKKQDGDLAIKKKEAKEAALAVANIVLPEENTPREDAKDTPGPQTRQITFIDIQKDQDGKKHGILAPTPVAKGHANDSSERNTRRKHSEEASLKEIRANQERNPSTGGSSDEVRKQSLEKIPKLNGMVSPRVSSENQILTLAIKSANSINVNEDVPRPLNSDINKNNPTEFFKHNPRHSLSPDANRPVVIGNQIKGLFTSKKMRSERNEHLIEDNENDPDSATILLNNNMDRYREVHQNRKNENSKKLFDNKLLDTEKSRLLALEIKNELLKQKFIMEGMVLDVVSGIIKSRFEFFDIVMKKEKPRNRNYSEDVIGYPEGDPNMNGSNINGTDGIKENNPNTTVEIIRRIPEFYKNKVLQSPQMSSSLHRLQPGIVRSRSHSNLSPDILSTQLMEGSSQNRVPSICEMEREDEPMEDLDSSLMVKLLPCTDLDVCPIGVLNRIFSTHRKWRDQKAEQFSLEEDLFVIMIVEEDNYLEKQLEKIEFYNPKKIVKAKNSFLALQNYNMYVTEGFIFGLIIVSLNLYPLNGDYLVHEIRKYEKMQNIPRTEIYGVIEKDQPIEEESLWDFDHLLRKPLNSERLKKVINVGNSIIDKSFNERDHRNSN